MEAINDAMQVRMAKNRRQTDEQYQVSVFQWECPYSKQNNIEK